MYKTERKDYVLQQNLLDHEALTAVAEREPPQLRCDALRLKFSA